MPSPLRPLYRSILQHQFRHHVRIRPSLFARSCSCSAVLHATGARNGAAATGTSVRTPTSSTESISTNGSAKARQNLPKPTTDHRELAIAQGLFTTSPYSPGSPLLLPNGADMFTKLADFLRAQYTQFGFREVITPTIYKKSLWEKSGHWENYAEDMFEVKGRGLSGQKEGMQIGEEEEFGLKPMNCPGHCLLFAGERRSYRDLPVRFADFSALHRNEVSGALSGLTRVRRFHQDDGHIFCLPSQIEDEIRQTIAFVQLVYNDVFNLGSFRFVLSTRPADHYIGTPQEWESAENQLKAALDHAGLEWQLNEGDGAFYGPKIDIILKDSAGKEHQTATIQLDFQLPQRFGLSYQAGSAEADSDGASAVPVLIHRAVLGSLERFMALLIEHYDGIYPFWIAPRPCMVMSVTTAPEQLEYARNVAATLAGQPMGGSVQKMAVSRSPLRIDQDVSARSVSKKIAEAKGKGYNMIVVVGPQEVASGTVAVKITRNQHDAQQVEHVLRDVIEAGRTHASQSSTANAEIGRDREGNMEVKHLQPVVLRRLFERLQDHYL